MLARASFLEYIKKTNYKANCIEQSNFSGSNRIQLKCLISFVASSISAVAEERSRRGPICQRARDGGNTSCSFASRRTRRKFAGTWVQKFSYIGVSGLY